MNGRQTGSSTRSVVLRLRGAGICSVKGRGKGIRLSHP